MITITETEYLRLLADSEFLRRLRDAGVDNWDGYQYGYIDDDDDYDDRDYFDKYGDDNQND